MSPFSFLHSMVEEVPPLTCESTETERSVSGVLWNVTGASLPPPPKTVAEIRQGVIDYLGHIDSLDDLTRAALASPASEEVRAGSMARRFDAFRPIVESIEPPLSKVDRGRILRLIVVLTQSSALRMLHDHLGQSPEQVADDVAWFVRAAVAAADGRARR